jgi:hypothetical protein
LGYQGFVICPIYNFYLKPSFAEIKHGLAPDAIGVTGNDLKDGHSLKTIVVPAFRFSHLHKARLFHPNSKQFTIFMPFSICEKTSLSNLEILTKSLVFLVVDIKVNVVVKLHPSMNLNLVKPKIFNINKNVKISEKSFEHTLQMSNILLGSTSSACVEAIIYGINVIIIASRNNLTANPIPVKYNDYYKICYSEVEVCDEINRIMTNLNFQKLKNEFPLNDIFYKSDSDSVGQFILNLNGIKNFL